MIESHRRIMPHLTTMKDNSCCKYMQPDCSGQILCLLNEDLLNRIQSYLLDPSDHKSFRLVCRAFYRVDSFYRTHLRPLRPDYLPYILTKFPSLEVLDLSVCPRVDNSLAATIAPICQHLPLRALGLSRVSGLTHAGLETLVRSCGAELEVVDVSYWCRRFGDREALAVSCAVGLRELRLDKCLSVTDVGLAQIAVGCVGLEKLSLKWCLEITDLGIDLLTKKCLGLKSLDISFLKITSESVGSIASLQMLESLVMVGCTLVDDLGLHLLGKQCPSLKEVDMSRCDGITSAGLCSVVKGHCGLQLLNASHCMVDLTSDILCALKALRCLKVFRADGARVSHSSFQILSTKCRSLVEIGLSKCRGLTDADVVQLVTGCGNLRILNLSCSDAVTDAAIAAIASSCRKLHCLKLESCASITELNLGLLGCWCTGLEELDVTDCCGINDTALGFLSRCRELKFLKLGLCNNISDKGLSYVASKCCNICELDLYRCPDVGDDGMAVLSNGCKKLKKLNVSYCNSLTDTGMEHIGKMEELYDLEMRGLMRISGAGLQAVAAGCKRLAQIDLKHCANVQDLGFWALANYSKNIRQINFSNCAISDVGLLMVMSNLICLQDAKLVHLANVSARGFELALRAACIRLKKVKLSVCLKFTLSPDILQFLSLRGCKLRWESDQQFSQISFSSRQIN